MNIEITKLTAKTDYSRKGEPYKWNNKLYVWLDGESVLENLVNRRSRPHTFYKKEIIPLIMEKLAASSPDIHTAVRNEKWGWRQKCGCSMCPCSPGFVGSGYSSYEIHASVLITE